MVTTGELFEQNSSHGLRVLPGIVWIAQSYQLQQEMCVMSSSSFTNFRTLFNVNVNSTGIMVYWKICFINIRNNKTFNVYKKQ